ncbi:unnamed protein product [Polarella glacialis]|uniref:Peptidase M48 domain-containing protein n=1 Tax=Polarella glacialis TaxID=89957 RepID=A0A813I234_POLGL|nr:unnamed protein product [Polarella glacialis]
MSVAWSSDRNQWALAEGEAGSLGTVYAVLSQPRLDLATASDRVEWTLTPEALAANSVKESSSESGGVYDPLVPAGERRLAETMEAVYVDAGSLRSNLLALAERLGYHGASIFVIDGSARSAHSNAFCTGFGSFRRICLFDTLLPIMSEGEILAVLGHEIGHDRLYHVHMRLVIGIAYSFLMLYSLGHFLTSSALSAAFFAPEPKVYLSVVFFSTAWGAVDFVMSLLLTAESRANEFAADRFAVEADVSYGELLGSALKKLMKKSKVNLTPHPFYVFLTYSHPPLDARIKAIRDHQKLKYGN